MVEEQIMNRGIIDPKVITAMSKVPRHLFVEEALWGRAYEDYPLPIGERQTISQPYIVARMTEALQLKGSERVLEIGSGSGYQTAILAEVADKVFSIERIRSLSIKARKMLEDLGYHNTILRIFDGTLGWKADSPFDAIIITAAAKQIPYPLLGQLVEGGRLIMPVGGELSQSLVQLTKTRKGNQEVDLGGCRFVKLIGEHGWKSD